MFTVKQLCKMAGVTPRTLHYYDQIGLLKPTQVGENGYRDYGEEALLRLQQILLYRQLDLPLEDVRRILDRPDFDVQRALESHRQELRKRIARMERLAATVDDTILHLKGQKPMSQKQFFAGFSEEQQAAYEKEAMELYDPEVVKASNRKWKAYPQAEKERILAEGGAIYDAIVGAIPRGPESPEAQAGVERWHRHQQYFWNPGDEQLLGLGELYNQDPRFKANFDKFDPRLAEFMREAIKVYVARRQKKA